jgi:hypothetical protein
VDSEDPIPNKYELRLLIVLFKEMKKTLIETIIALVCVLFLCSPIIAQQNNQTAVATLQHYIELRLNDADWKEYSKFITWPDEPGWDCKWVVSNYKIGQSKKRKQKIIIPVVYTRLGLFCSTPGFNVGKKEVTIKYELEKYSSGWKVSGPEIDYPEIGADKAIKLLKTLAANTSDSDERRMQAEAAARKIEEALTLNARKR